MTHGSRPNPLYSENQNETIRSQHVFDPLRYTAVAGPARWARLGRGSGDGFASRPDASSAGVIGSVGTWTSASTGRSEEEIGGGGRGEERSNSGVLGGVMQFVGGEGTCWMQGNQKRKRGRYMACARKEAGQ